MKLNKIVFLFYILLTLYNVFIIFATNITLSFCLPAIALTWGCFFCFFIGTIRFTKNRTDAFVYRKFPNDLSEKACMTLSILSILLAIQYAKFYTGQNIYDIFYNILNGISNYNNYQEYFKKIGIADVSICHKFPWILMGAYIYIWVVYIYIRALVIYNKLNFKNYVNILFSSIAYLYIGLSRGTNIELFYIFILLFYCFAKRCTRLLKHKHTDRYLLLKVFILLITLGMGMLTIFRLVLSLRGVVFGNCLYLDTNIIYDTDSFILRLFPELSFTIGSMFGYVGWGHIYISSVFKYVMTSLDTWGALILPSGFQTIMHLSLENIMKDTIDVGVKWTPNLVLWIDQIGLILTLILCWLIGCLNKIIGTVMRESSVKYMSEYMILIAMISLPMGNFINHSAQQITLMVLCFVICSKLLLTKKRDLYLVHLSERNVCKKDSIS